MKKTILPVMIVMICLALLGIIGVQFFWIRNAVKVKEEQFNRSVNDALTMTVGKLEVHGDILYMKKNMMGDSILELVQAFSADSIISLNSKLDSLLKKNDLIPPSPPPVPLLPNGYVFEYRYNGFGHLDTIIENFRRPGMIWRDELPDVSLEWNQTIDFRKIDSLLYSHYEKQTRKKKKPKTNKQHVIPDPVFIIDEPDVNMRPGTLVMGEEYIHNRNQSRARDDMRRITRKAQKIKDVIQKMAIELENKPLTLSQRIDTANIGKTLKKSLSEKGINLPFEFAIQSVPDSAMAFKSPGFRKTYLSTPHRVSLFPNDIFQHRDALLVYFPDQKKFLTRSVSLITLGSVFFTLIIILTSILSIIIMIRQKKISDIKTDFINNMTHEFKTPIATISIAVDSINNPKVIEDPDRIKGYTRVIKEENNRMNARVEQVLQMALLDSSEFKLNEKPFDVHTILHKVTDHLRLQIEKREGRIEFIPGAEHSVVRGDEAHLLSVFMNLLDNANKYSPGKPEIRVTTMNKNHRIIVAVEDRGIGMNQETQYKIFDKFFRVTSGNIHNIKGFGLGLSYAKAIVLAHKGEIRVSSESGKGSRFEVELPVLELFDS